MEKLKRKTFIVIFSILTIFLISILCIFNYQDYKHEKTEINNNLNKINIRNENIEFNIEKNKEEDQNKNKQTEENTIEKELNQNIQINEPIDKNQNIQTEEQPIEEQTKTEPIFMDAIVYTIIYNDQKEVIEILNHTQGTTSDNKIKEKAQEILNQENAKTIYVGNLYIEEYSYSFKGHNTLTIIDNQMSKNRLQSLLRMSIIIFIILEMIIIIISTKITSWIIKPVIETFNKQKQFITDASHELKTPVAVIMANAEALENEPEETKWLENIKSESERMNELISNLLDLAKLENGAQKEEYTTTDSDKSAILVENGGNATIEGATISKTGGDSTNTENSEFYGINSGILVTQNSTATIKNATIETKAKGSNAVFSTGTDSKIYINDSKINTTGSSSSRGLDATYGGYIEAENVEITTQGGSCATLATDRGEGTVTVKNSKLETNGSGSPIIYSTGNISIENTEGTANGSQMVVIEGKNTATVTNSTLTASGTGNRGETDQAGIMIYQSMSGDAGEGTGTFTATNSNLSIQANSKYYKTAPMFFITNTDAIINLKNCQLTYGSNTLISNKGTTEWGTTGTNGGNLTLNAENQTLEGNIEIDNISTLKMNLTNSQYTGTINGEQTAKQIDIKIDSNTKIKLTGNSYVTSLEDEDTTYSNIDFNGYTLYVNGTAIN